MSGRLEELEPHYQRPIGATHRIVSADRIGYVNLDEVEVVTDIEGPPLDLASHCHYCRLEHGASGALTLQEAPDGKMYMYCDLVCANNDALKARN